MSDSPPAPAESTPAAVADVRLRWRAVVNANRKGGDGHVDAGVAWHLSGCSAPSSADAHCTTGQLLLGAQADPDGHCLVDGACPRCASAATPAS